MTHLEIVELRSFDHRQEDIRRALDDLLDASQESGVSGIRVYRHTTVETDLSIHILHEDRTPLSGGSPLGFHLANFLRKFGLVNHDLWILAGIAAKENGGHPA